MSSFKIGALLLLGASSLVHSAPVNPKTKRAESGPKFDGTFPDPSIIQIDNTWYSFGTQGNGKNIQIATSSDFDSWTLLNSDALPTVGAWADPNAGAPPVIWAPDVVKVDDGSFVMYYAAPSKEDGKKHCVGAATSGAVGGPYQPLDNALACPLDKGGAIDASWFVDSGGQRYVLYKVDGNAVGNGGDCGNAIAPFVPTPIMIQAIAGDGVTLQGDPRPILDNNGAGDTGNVEAPSLVKAPDNTYALFFSSNCYSTPGYTVNYATSGSIFGPYTRTSRPLFQTGDNGLTAPGGASIANDGVHMTFHAGQALPDDQRKLYTATVNINGGTITA